MTVRAYVTIHDQQLVLDCEREGRFDAVPHTYLFVGPRPVDRLDGLDLDVIVARDIVPNYEHYPQFYDFTGWFALTRAWVPHPDADQLLCVQYDHQISDPTISVQVAQLLEQEPSGPVAFVAGHRYAHNWMLLIDGFEATFRHGMATVGVNVDTFPDFNEWPSTQGTAWRIGDLTEFMDWFEPLFDTWAGSTWAGHLAERSVWAWMLTTGRPARFATGLVHEGRDCHGTCRLMAGDSATWEARAATFGR